MSIRPKTMPDYHPKGEQECGCRACGYVFANSKAFDVHRVGRHGVDRECAYLPDCSSLYVNSKGLYAVKLSDKQINNIQKLRERSK